MWVEEYLLKTSPVGDFTTDASAKFSRVTQQLGQISKIRPEQSLILCPSLRMVSCQLQL